MDRGTFDILLNVLRPAVTRENAEGGRRAGEEIGVVSGETIRDRSFVVAKKNRVVEPKC